jgi:hypothetical protein
MRGQTDRYQKPGADLAFCIASGLKGPTTGVLNALIPPPGVGAFVNQRWQTYVGANAGILGLIRDWGYAGEYGSASISRMDSCPQLHTEEWWLSVSQLWADKEITLIRGSDRSLTAQRMLDSPGSPEAVAEVLSPSRNAWDQYDRLFKETMDAGHQTVILCTGLVARPLVHKLVAHGLRAYDLGHLGLWFREGKPIEVAHP